MTPHPPTWAQWLLSSVLPGQTRDSVLGDLVEEYAESQLPSRGRRRADWWYVRQTTGFLWRASRAWALLIGVDLGTRAILDTFVRTNDQFHLRAILTTYVTIALYVGMGVYTGWRTRRVAGAGVIAVMAALAGCAIAWTVPSTITVLLSMRVLPSVRSLHGLRESFDLPALPLAVVGSVLAMIGAAIGRLGTRDSGLPIPG